MDDDRAKGRVGGEARRSRGEFVSDEHRIARER